MKKKTYLSGLAVFAIFVLVSFLYSGAFNAFAQMMGPSDSMVASALIVPEYNPRDEFSLTQGGTNTLWNYGVSTSDADNTLTLFSPTDILTQSSGCNGGSFEKWLKEPSGDQLPQIARHNPAATCSNIPANAVFMHPGRNNQRVVLRFNTPTSGTFQITGTFQKQNLSATTDLKIIKNGGLPGETVLFTGVIGAFYQQAFNLSVALTSSDKIDFSVGDGDNGQNSDGSTLAVTIGEPIVACLTAPANLQVNVPAENSPMDVQSVNTNAQLGGNATYTDLASGKVGRAFQFDGDGDQVRIEDNAAQKPINQITVEGWFKFNNFNGYPHLVSKPLRISYYNSYVIWYDGSLRIGYYDTTGTWRGPGTGYQPQIGVWTHYAMVINTDDTGPTANTMKLYVNGVEVFSDTAGAPIFYNGINDAYTPHPLLIGGEIDNENIYYFLNGGADEVSVYGRALSQPEIFNIVKQGSYGKCPPANCVQPPNDLVSWFAGEQNVLDSRSANHGTLQNGATFAAGKVGQAFSFDGVNDKVSVPNSPSLDITGNQLTIEAWINPTDVAGNRQIVSMSTATTQPAGRKYGLYVQNGLLGFEINANGGYANPVPSGSITPGVFTHVAGVYNGSQMVWYINGNVVGTSSAASGNIVSNGGEFTIGQFAVAGASSFQGLIDEVGVYNRALSQTELQSIFSAGPSGKCKPSPINPPANQTAWFTGDSDARNFTGLTTSGTLVGDTTYRVGRVGQAYKFDGNGDYVSTVDSSYWDFGTNDLAIESWINTPSPSGFQRIISAGSMADGANSLWTLGYGDGWGGGVKLNFAVYNGSGYSDFYSSPIAIRPNTWHHVAMVRSGTTLRFYLDGVPSGTDTIGAAFAINGGSSGAILGARYNANASSPFEFANGMLDEISIYQRAVTANEIAAVYNAGVAGKLKSKSTAVGANVQTQLSDATVTFASVSSSGTSTQSNIDLGMMPPLPPGQRFTGLAYNITSNAGYQNGTADDVRVCFNLPSLAAIGAGGLRILHLEGGSWVDRTAAGNTLANFCTDDLTSLSPFVITEGSAPINYSVSGQITVGGTGLSGVSVAATGPVTRTTTTDANGNYSFTGLNGGDSFTITPNYPGYIFTPTTRNYPSLSANITDANFTAASDGLCGADYRFNNNLESTILNRPALSYIGAAGTFVPNVDVNGTSQTVLNFTAGNSVELRPTTGVIPSNEYDIRILVRMDQVYSYSRILDFKDGADAGLYVTSGNLTFYGAGVGGPGPSVTAGVWTEIRVTRTAAGIFTAYTNGVQQFSFNDVNGLAIIGPTNALRFFRDDAGEHHAGSLARIRLSSSSCGSTNSIAGRVTEGANNLSGVSVALSGGASSTTTTDANGNYSFANLPSGLNYTVTPTLANYTFSPPTRGYNDLATNVEDANFAAVADNTQCLPAPTGVQNWYKFENNASDVFNLHSGTAQGSPTFGPGRVGQAINFDGVDDSVDLGNWFNYQTFSLSMWINVAPFAEQPTYANIVDNNHTGSTNWVVQRVASENRYAFGDNSGGEVFFVPTPNTWQLLTLTRDATAGLRVYLDGALVEEDTTVGTIPYNGSQFLRLGRWGGGGRHLKGKIDEFDVYNRVLTPAEVQAIYSAGGAGKCAPQCFNAPTEQVAWYRGDNSPLDWVNPPSHAAMENGATFAIGKVGYAFSMDGTDDFVAAPDSDKFDITGDLTVEAWVRPAQVQSGEVTLISKRDSANSNVNYVLFLRDGELRFASRSGGGAFSDSGSGVTLAAGTFSHVAATVEDGSLRFYVNGAATPAQSVPTTRSGSTGRLTIGATEISNTSGFFSGLIDEVSIYSRALTAAEITGINDAGAGGKCLPGSYPLSYSIGGRLTSTGIGLANIPVRLSDGPTVYGNIATDANGYFLWYNLQPGGNYTVTPISTEYTFAPASRSYTSLADNVNTANFTGVATNCTFSLSPDNASFGAAGGSGSFNITTQPGCQWIAAASNNIASWVTINGASSGTGNGTVNYIVAANTSILRYGDILINGATSHFIGQETGMGTCPNVMPITYGTTLNGALDVSDCNLSGRFTDQYSFAGTAGDRVMIRLSSSDFAESLILHNTANTTIYTFTTGGAANDARIPNSFGFYTLPATGTYIISASNWGNGGSPTGNYMLTLHSDRTVPGVTPPSGLIGWYAGEGDTRNQQGASPGTFNGTATYTTDYVGQSFSLNGTDRYIEVPSAIEPFNVASLSVESWVNTSTLNGDLNTSTPKYRTIASKFNGAGGASWSLDMEQGGAIIFTVYDGSTTNYRAVRTNGAAALLVANEWKHVAATFDQTTQSISLYVNGADAGQLVAGSAASISGIGQNSVPLRIGANQNGAVQGFWQGRLDEVSIYNRALTSSEITSIVDAGRIGKVKQAAIVDQTSANLGSSTVTFGAPTSGTVTETPIDGSALPAALPQGTGLQLAFDISTNAPFTGNALVCFAVPSVTPTVFATLKVYHFEGGTWVDRTGPGNVYPNLCALTPSFSPFAIAAPLAPSASNVSVGGRVQTVDGRGINNTILSLSMADGSVRRVRSSSFGYYSFENIESGQSVVLSIYSKRFTFIEPTRVVTISDELVDLNFIAEP